MDGLPLPVDTTLQKVSSTLVHSLPRNFTA